MEKVSGWYNASLQVKQAIEEYGFQAGKDVTIGLDPVMSELDNAYRKEYQIPTASSEYFSREVRPIL